MAFSSKKRHHGQKVTTVFGEFTQEAGDTGGTVVTGLKNLLYFHADGMTGYTQDGNEVTFETADPAAGGPAKGKWKAEGFAGGL